MAILLLAAFSMASILYGFFLFLAPHNALSHSGDYTFVSAGAVVLTKGQPSSLLLISAGVLGLFATFYGTLYPDHTLSKGSMRKQMSNHGFDRNVYRIFSGRGAPTRIAIMYSLETPRLRNEIACMTNTDWKEVDRNIRILESADLVNIEFSHGSLSVYCLTESGRELLDIIRANRRNGQPDAGAVHF